MHIKHNDYLLTILRQFRKKYYYRYTQNFSLHFSESLFCKTAHCNRHSDKIGIMFAIPTIQRLSPHILLDRPYQDPYRLLSLGRSICLRSGGKKCSSLAMDIRVLLGACRSDEGNASAERLCPLSCVVETPTWTILEVLSSHFLP